MNKLIALLSLLQNTAIYLCLLLLLALFFRSVNQPGQQTHIPPANDAAGEEADDLPFGPTPKN